MYLVFHEKFLGLRIVKVKQSHYKTGRAPEGFRRFRLPDYKKNRHMKVVRLSALCTGRLYPPENISRG
jgi:hypothetical protein